MSLFLLSICYYLIEKWQKLATIILLMNKIYLFLLFLLYLISPPLLFAEDHYTSREWLNLLYYEQSGSGYKSLAEEDGFFITKQGKTNPKDEYEASLKLVLAQDLTFKTKFPLRYKYIVKQHNLQYAPAVQVPANINKVLIAYPNRYMNNPASMFGHLFLVLETNKGILDSDILHYIADTAADRSIGYMIKGLSGQYKGWFLREPYYKKIKGYNYVEDRDIIYYDLKLSKEQTENLQLHYIELQNSFFYYYFLDKNCAFFIGKLLNIVLDSDIATKRSYIIPSQIINDLFDVNLLENERLRVANTKVFNRLFTGLNDEQKRGLITLFHEKKESIQADPDVLKAFIIISEYMISNHSDLADNIRSNRITAYKKLKDLETSNIRQTDVKKESVNRIQSESIGLSRVFNNYYEISFNPIYFSEYDHFNILEVISVKGLGTKINLYPNGHPLYQLDLVDLNNIIQSNDVLNSFSWKIKSSIFYKDSILTNQEVYYGFSWNVMNRGLLYSLVGLNYTNFDDISEINLDSLKLLPTIQIGLNHNLTDNLKIIVSYENKFQKDYITTGFIYKYNNLLNKLILINNKDHSTVKLSFEYLL
ncbi:MAG: hypothetical protein DKM50_09805 [Candidatus Margulisiibacteriota bacterium]|nr:MAG: hypothetical protein DKM50_09805 [Candidatus Margulisiibacteriota bacterium]HCY37126.1 hypothetical protein [Candidatus Margulisiibacteriota bacterium]